MADQQWDAEHRAAEDQLPVEALGALDVGERDIRGQLDRQTMHVLRASSGLWHLPHLVRERGGEALLRRARLDRRTSLADNPPHARQVEKGKTIVLRP